MANGYPKELEVQRIENLTVGFGWKKTKEEIIGKNLYVTFMKTILSDDDLESPPTPS